MSSTEYGSANPIQLPMTGCPDWISAFSLLLKLPSAGASVPPVRFRRDPLPLVLKIRVIRRIVNENIVLKYKGRKNPITRVLHISDLRDDHRFQFVPRYGTTS
jgi:hypothetical protein